MSPAKQPREEVHVDVEGRTLRLSNLDKVLYPRTGTTKGEVLHYYAQVAPTLLPHLADRAVTRIRWPHGVAEGSFFEKNVPQGTPSWVRTVSVPTTGSRGESRHGDRLVFPVVDDLATLTWLVNLAALELHVHQWRVGRNGRPRNADRIVIDLALAREVAEELQAAHPRLVTATMTKARRSGKVFLDWSQNASSKTTITPYSLRGRDKPFVATPVSWAEVEAGAEDPVGLEQVRMEEVLERVADLGDLFS